MIVCGWCGKVTRDASRCEACGHENPRIPYDQRGLPVPDGSTVNRRRLHEAEAHLRTNGESVTVARLAEYLDVSERTVRRWRGMSAL